MPDTYTKEQIEKLISQPIDGILYDLNLLPECFDIPTAWRNPALEAEVIKSLKSSLSTAEQERDEAKQFRQNVEIHFEMLCTDEIRAHAFADVTHDLDFQIFRVLGGYQEALDEINVLKARCAELEARLQGAADRAVKCVHEDFNSEMRDLWGEYEDNLIRAAILGEKKED